MQEINENLKGLRSIGDAAKQMGVSVRTLQYYDKIGLLKPTISQSGRRFYSDKDIILLHQILSLKFLGFSLEEIKNRLILLETPADVAAALDEQANLLREKIAGLSHSLQATERLKAEALKMREVDFRKYADIVVNLQMGNRLYWMIKNLDDAFLEFARGRFDSSQSKKFIEAIGKIWEKAAEYARERVPANSEKGIALAKEFWGLLLEFTEGSEEMIRKISEKVSNQHFDQPWKEAYEFLEAALGAYFAPAQSMEDGV